MEVEYSSNRLKKQLSSPGDIKKSFGNMAKKVASRLDDIAASDNLSILCQIPAANCHPLTGDRIGQWALDISGNFRMIFEIANNPIPLKEDKSVDKILVTIIEIVEITDYH